MKNNKEKKEKERKSNLPLPVWVGGCLPVGRPIKINLPPPVGGCMVVGGARASRCHHSTQNDFLGLRLPFLNFWASIVMPSDQMSAFGRVPFSWIISGAIQYGVPITVFCLLIVDASWADTPKSASFTMPCSVSRIFPALMSRWMFLLKMKQDI